MKMYLYDEQAYSLFDLAIEHIVDDLSLDGIADLDINQSHITPEGIEIRRLDDI